MRLVAAPDTYQFEEDGGLNVILYGQPTLPSSGGSDRGSVGAAVLNTIVRERLRPDRRAWDFLSLALAVLAADRAAPRSFSPDGWTRELAIKVAVTDATFWSTQSGAIEAALRFLTTDVWKVEFLSGGRAQPRPSDRVARPNNDCVVLLSGGLDSLIGAIDLAKQGRKPATVSQIVTGDAAKQEAFANTIGGGLRRFAFNPNTYTPTGSDDSQRARSIGFIAFGVLIATTLLPYQRGDDVPLFLCENGFIAINPPLTGTRVGSLSTRTAHPEFLARIRDILRVAGVGVSIQNPYGEMTKGEMMAQCQDQGLLSSFASASTSCGRYRRFGYKHCGRCVPCQVRRAAFLKAGLPDSTVYVYEDLGKDDAEHARFDDVRSVAMAVAEVKSDGLESWIGGALSFPKIGNVGPLKSLVGRGLEELAALQKRYGVK